MRSCVISEWVAQSPRQITPLGAPCGFSEGSSLFLCPFFVWQIRLSQKSPLRALMKTIFCGSPEMGPPSVPPRHAHSKPTGHGRLLTWSRQESSKIRASGLTLWPLHFPGVWLGVCISTSLHLSVLMRWGHRRLLGGLGTPHIRGNSVGGCSHYCHYMSLFIPLFWVMLGAEALAELAAPWGRWQGSRRSPAVQGDKSEVGGTCRASGTVVGLLTQLPEKPMARLPAGGSRVWPGEAGAFSAGAVASAGAGGGSEAFVGSSNGRAFAGQSLISCIFQRCI